MNQFNTNFVIAGALAGPDSIMIFFLEQLTFDMFNVWGQHRSFFNHEWMFLIKSWSFWDRKCLIPQETWTLNL